MSTLTKKQREKGFSLVEIVVVIAIIAILSLLVIGAIVLARNAATEATNRQNGQTIRLALEAFYSRHAVYCDSPAAITCSGMVGDTFTQVAADLNAQGAQVRLANTTTAGGGGRITEANPQNITYEVLNASGNSTIVTVTFP